MRPLRRTECFLCMDEGFILQPVGGSIYTTLCHCTCEAGNDYRIESADEKPGRKWRAPCITSMIDKAEIERIMVTNSAAYAKIVEADKARKEQELKLPVLKAVPQMQILPLPIERY